MCLKYLQNLYLQKCSSVVFVIVELITEFPFSFFVIKRNNLVSLFYCNECLLSPGNDSKL